MTAAAKPVMNTHFATFFVTLLQTEAEAQQRFRIISALSETPPGGDDTETLVVTPHPLHAPADLVQRLEGWRVDPNRACRSRVVLLTYAQPARWRIDVPGVHTIRLPAAIEFLRRQVHGLCAISEHERVAFAGTVALRRSLAQLRVVRHRASSVGTVPLAAARGVLSYVRGGVSLEGSVPPALLGLRLAWPELRLSLGSFLADVDDCIAEIPREAQAFPPLVKPDELARRVSMATSRLAELSSEAQDEIVEAARNVERAFLELTKTLDSLSVAIHNRLTPGDLPT